MKKRNIIILLILVLMVSLGVFYFSREGNLNKSEILINSLAVVDKVTQFLPINQDTKDELQAIDKIVQYFTAEDGVERRYLIMLQNNMELRPTGGFLGQYAVVKIKDGEVISLFVEDANLLDQRITADVPAPYPFEGMMSVRRWKFRDANFFPDFPSSVEKVKYFYRLAGGNDDFDGVIAVNATVFNDALEITGPITVPGFPGTYTSENAVLKLEEQVGKAYRLNPDLDDRNRKIILKKMAAILIDELSSISNFSKVSNLVFEELRNKEIQFYFEDQGMQALAEKVGWAGKVNQEWEGDYLMAVDANLGALKSDYYMDREMIYNVDLTAEKPTATLEIIYTHNAIYGDWRTTDYHSYLRVYTPLGTELVSREMVSYPNIQENHGRQYFGFICHTIMNDQTHAKIVYTLPEELRENYKLLIQKQSGVGEVPVTINVKTAEKEYSQKEVLKNELKFEFRKE
jgi:hypothetical protein